MCYWCLTCASRASGWGTLAVSEVDNIRGSQTAALLMLLSFQSCGCQLWSDLKPACSHLVNWQGCPGFIKLSPSASFLSNIETACISMKAGHWQCCRQRKDSEAPKLRCGLLWSTHQISHLLWDLGVLLDVQKSLAHSFIPSSRWFGDSFPPCRWCPGLS